MSASSSYAYSCPRCGYCTNDKSNFAKHLQRKTICDPSLADVDVSTMLTDLTTRTYHDKASICDNCGKRFNTRQSKYRHMKTCQTHVSSLAKKVASLEERLACMHPSSTNNTNNGTYYNAPVTNNITINLPLSPPLRNFGNDNMDAVPNHFLENAIMNLQIKELIKELHFDPNYPENHNIRLTSLKRNLIQMYVNNQWQTMPMLKGIDDLISQATDIFIDYYKKNEGVVKENVGEEEAEKLLRRLRDLEAVIRDKFRRNVERDVQCLMIDTRSAMQKTM